jgi:hypothetical protein
MHRYEEELTIILVVAVAVAVAVCRQGDMCICFCDWRLKCSSEEPLLINPGRATAIVGFA